MRKVSLVRVQNSERLRFNSSSGDSVSVSGGLYAFGNHLEIDCRQAGIRCGPILVGCLGRRIMLARNGNASDEQLQQVQHRRDWLPADSQRLLHWPPMPCHAFCWVHCHRQHSPHPSRTPSPARRKHDKIVEASCQRIGVPQLMNQGKDSGYPFHFNKGGKSSKTTRIISAARFQFRSCKCRDSPGPLPRRTSKRAAPLPLWLGRSIQSLTVDVHPPSLSLNQEVAGS